VVSRSLAPSVRRERMGHVELAAPVTHICTSRVCRAGSATLLDLAPKDLEKIIYFAAYVITSVNDEQRHNDLPTLENEMGVERKRVEQRRDADLEGPRPEARGRRCRAGGGGRQERRPPQGEGGGERGDAPAARPCAAGAGPPRTQIWSTFAKLATKQLIADEMLYRELYDRYGDYFTGAMGAEAIQKLVQTFDIPAEAENLRRDHPQRQGTEEAARASSGLKVVAAFQITGNKPARHGCWTAVPVIRRPAPDGAAGRWPVRHLRPERPVPPRDQPEQPVGSD